MDRLFIIITNKKFLFSLAIILALGLVIWFLLWPATKEVSQARKDLKSWQEKLTEARQSKQKLETLKTKYQSLKDEEDRILNAIPNSEDLPGLLIQLEALTSQNGLILNSIDFTYPAEEKTTRAAVMETETPAAASALPANVKVLSISLGLTGNYGSLKNFLKAVENNLRLTDISIINFSEESTSLEKSESGGGKLNVILTVYYKK